MFLPAHTQYLCHVSSPLPFPPFLICTLHPLTCTIPLYLAIPLTPPCHTTLPLMPTTPAAVPMLLYLYPWHTAFRPLCSNLPVFLARPQGVLMPALLPCKPSRRTFRATPKCKHALTSCCRVGSGFGLWLAMGKVRVVAGVASVMVIFRIKVRVRRA